MWGGGGCKTIPHITFVFFFKKQSFALKIWINPKVSTSDVYMKIIILEFGLKDDCDMELNRNQSYTIHNLDFGVYYQVHL